MSDTPEHLAAILAEFRAFALRAAEEDKMISPESVLLLVDKVETAAERERNAHTNDIHDALYKATGIPGNAAGLRGALSDAVRWLSGILQFCDRRRTGEEIRVPAYSAFGTIDRLREALASPARNCDRPECADVESAWATCCAETNRADCKGFARWLFAPAKGGAE